MIVTSNGERHGLAVSIEAFRSKGRGFESPRRLSLLKNVSCRGNKECIVRGRRRRIRRRRRSRTCKTRSGIETCKTRRSRQTAKAIESGMVTRNGLVRFEDDEMVNAKQGSTW